MAPTSASDVALVRGVIRAMVERHFPGSQPERLSDDVHRVIGVDDRAKDDEHEIRVFFPSAGQDEKTNPTFLTANYTIPRINVIEDDEDKIDSLEPARQDMLRELNLLITGREEGTNIGILTQHADGQMRDYPMPKVRVSSSANASSVGVFIYGHMNELAAAIRSNLRTQKDLRQAISDAGISFP